jgi:hypothetical protein
LVWGIKTFLKILKPNWAVGILVPLQAVYSRLHVVGKLCNDKATYWLINPQQHVSIKRDLSADELTAVTVDLLSIMIGNIDFNFQKK